MITGKPKRREIVVMVPPLDEQRKLVKMLEDIDHAIELRYKQIDLHDELKKTIERGFLSGEQKFKDVPK